MATLCQQYSGDEKLDAQLSLWLKWDKNKKTLAEIEQLVAKKNWDELRKRLLNRLQFGTAGLRGKMQSGFDSMNDLVIVQTAQGFSDYINMQFPDEKERKERGIVLGYDGRYNSKRFAELSATVFTHCGTKVWLYSKEVITPFVPFAISRKKCLAGIMVTASHNPKDDNGYKVYWENGTQIISPHDKCIQKSILDNLEPKQSSWCTEVLQKNPLVVDPYEDMFAEYFSKLSECLPKAFMRSNKSSELRFVYTAMHGVGYPFIQEAFRTAHLLPVVDVKEQCTPDPDFPTVQFPNPEEGKSSLELSMKKADENCISIILANDPDADRLACAEKDAATGQWKVFNGNELGALLGWWSLQTYTELHKDVKLADCYMLASTVSSKILRAIAQAEGLNFIETLTGFKWMGNRAVELIAEGKKVLFAFEEAIGFMITTNVIDKDGVSAACHLATLASYLKQNCNGMTLAEKLNQIYTQYGYHCTNNSYLFCYEQPTIRRIFERLRNFKDKKPKTYPESILNGEFRIKHVRDLTTGLDTSQKDGKAILPVSASSQMITFNFENGMVITLRTSGTEPKIKYYAEMCAQPNEKDFKQLRKTLDRMVAAVVEEFLQPKQNNLTPKKD